MATQIPLGTPAYLTSFVDGQGAGAAGYVTYASDMDINFLLLRSTVNQIIVEIQATQGQNAVVGLDLCLWDDVDNPISTPAEQNFGVVGAASYEVSVEGGGTLQVKKGQAFVNGQRVSLVLTMTGVSSSGGAGTRWVAIDANGAVYVEALAAQKSLDIASVTWNGTIFTGTPTHLADVFFDGDSWAEVRNRNAAGAGFPAVVYRRVSERFEFLEQSLSAATGGASVIALPPGSAGTPGLVFSDGAGAADTTTGWFRQAANIWSYAVATAETLRLTAVGILITVAGSTSTPALRIGGDTTTGFYRQAANVWGFVVSTAEILRFAAQGILGIVGTVGAPTYSFLGRLTTGLYSPAADVAGLAGGGELAIEAGSIAAGGCGFPNVLRCKANNVGSVQTLTTTTWEVIDLDNDPDAYDIGGWHDPAGANPDRFTVPANAAGLYHITAHAHFDDPVSALNDRGARITVDGTPVNDGDSLIKATGSHDTSVNVAFDTELAVGEIVRVECFEDQPAVDIDVEVWLSVRRVA